MVIISYSLVRGLEVIDMVIPDDGPSALRAPACHGLAQATAGRNFSIEKFGLNPGDFPDIRIPGYPGSNP